MLLLSLLQAVLSHQPHGAQEPAALGLLRMRRVLASCDTLKHATAQCRQDWAGLSPSLEQERVC